MNSVHQTSGRVSTGADRADLTQPIGSVHEPRLRPDNIPLPALSPAATGPEQTYSGPPLRISWAERR